MNHRYRKKPIVIVIEAFQMTEEVKNAAIEFAPQSDWPEWLAGAMSKDNDAEGCFLWDIPTQEVVIVTLEGKLTVALNDWIIQGVQGEIYPCKPDIFAETYDPAPGETK